MSHFAKVLDGKVLDVIVAEQDFIDSYVDTVPGEWIQTSYNTLGNKHLLDGTPLRKNYAGVGYTYDAVKDKFIKSKPFASWSLDENDDWKAPVEYPADGDSTNWYTWDESVYQGDNTKGWIAVE